MDVINPGVKFLVQYRYRCIKVGGSKISSDHALYEIDESY